MWKRRERSGRRGGLGGGMFLIWVVSGWDLGVGGWFDACDCSCLDTFPALVEKVVFGTRHHLVIQLKIVNPNFISNYLNGSFRHLRACSFLRSFHSCTLLCSCTLLGTRCLGSFHCR